MGMRPYVFWNYPYTPGSAGVRAIYLACVGMISRGIEAVVAMIPDNARPGPNPFGVKTLTRDSLPKDAIHVLPDSANRNLVPTDGPVVWWILYKIGKWSSPPDVGPNDVVFVWQPCMCPGVSIFRVNTMEMTTFKPKKAAANSGRTAYYVGKGKMDRSKIPPDSTEIRGVPHRWPENREHLATLLREIDLLISFDPVTALDVEATLCGTPVRIHLEGSDWSKETLDKEMLEWPGFAFADDEIPEAKEKAKTAYDYYASRLPEIWGTMDNFIDVTQRMFK